MMSERELRAVSDRLDVLIMMVDQLMCEPGPVSNMPPSLVCDFELLADKARQRYEQRVSAAEAAMKHMELMSQINELEADYPQLRSRI